MRLAPIVSVNDRIEVTATRARDGADPVSFTNVPKEKIAEAYWAQDPAMLLAQVVPGFYATNDSGNGIGYSYFSIRGFGQARTRVMLNGAPLNDAESGELFFIDLADFMSTSSDVQVQRGVFGLSGLGGAVDIMTALPLGHAGLQCVRRARARSTPAASRSMGLGLVDGRWALSARYSKITTDGYRDQSWVDMWNYYLALARYGERSRLHVVLFGGPEQTHLAYEGVSETHSTAGSPATRTVIGAPIPSRTRARSTTSSSRTTSWCTTSISRTATHSARRPTCSRATATTTSSAPAARSWNTTWRTSALPGAPSSRRRISCAGAMSTNGMPGWVPSLKRTSGRWTFGLQGEVRVHRAHHEGTVTWAQYYPLGVAPNQPYYDYRAGKATATVAGNVRFAASPRLSLSGGLQVAHHGYTLSDDHVKGVTMSPPTYNFLLPRAGAVFTLGPRQTPT